jgi:uncharacterized protein Yka (UPF0111/DUF47 family)
LRLRRDESLLGEALSASARHLAAAARQLAAALDTEPEARAASTRRLRELDHDAEASAHAVIQGLAASFVTPFDRADVFRIGWSIRRVTARIDAAGDTIEVLRIGDLPGRAADLVQLIVRACDLVAAAVPRLGTPGNLAGAWVDLTGVIKQSGQVHRRLLLDVTSTVADPAQLARTVEAAGALRRVVEALDALADTLQTVVVTES